MRDNIRWPKYRHYLLEQRTDGVKRYFPWSKLNRTVLTIDTTPFIDGVPEGCEIVGEFWFDNGLKWKFYKGEP